MFCTDVILVEQLELVQLGFFLRVGADHPHARQILLHPAADIGKHLLDHFEAVVNALAEQHHRDAHQRRRNQADQRELPIHRQHDGDGEHRGEHGLGPVHDARAQHHAHGVQIVGGARHDVAGAIAGVEIGRERHQVREQLIAKIEFDVARNADQDHAHPILENPFEHPVGHAQDRGVVARGDFQPVIGGQQLANGGYQPELAKVSDANNSTPPICRDVAGGPTAG